MGELFEEYARDTPTFVFMLKAVDIIGRERFEEYARGTPTFVFMVSVFDSIWRAFCRVCPDTPTFIGAHPEVRSYIRDTQ